MARNRTGLSRYDDYDDEGDAQFSGDGPSADLRVAADMESIGQEYHGKKVSRKTLEATSGMVGTFERGAPPIPCTGARSVLESPCELDQAF